MCCPGSGPRLGVPALRILRHRGLDVRLETTVEEITDRWVRLSDGTTVPTHTLVWCVGVTPGPLTRALGLDTVKGRIVVDEFLTVPGHPHVFAAGDAAAVPDKIGQVYGDALAAAPPGFDIAAPVNVIVTDDLSDALRAAKTTIGFYIGVGDFHLDAVSRMGFEEAGRKVQELYLAGRPDEAYAAVPDELADGMCLLGPIGRIRERLELWRKSPVTTLLVAGPTSEPDLRRYTTRCSASPGSSRPGPPHEGSPARSRTPAALARGKAVAALTPAVSRVCPDASATAVDHQ